ncbi:MAG: HAD family hydrolase [Bacteroidota bacterium]
MVSRWRLPPTPISHPSPKAVVFDLDDTLLDHRRAERSALADLHREHPDTLGRHALAHVQATYHAHNVPLWRDFGKSVITSEQLKRLRFEHTLTALDAHQLDAATFGRRYLDLYADHWTWTDGAEAAFHAVADQIPVAILTNGFSEQQRAKLATMPALAERSEAVWIAEEVGAWKPHREVFALATTDLSESLGLELAPSDVLYIGDSYHSDVVGGTDFGWQVAWFRGDADLQPNGAWAFSDWADLLLKLELAT